MRPAVTTLLCALGLGATVALAIAEPPPERSDREAKFSREDIDEAIRDAEESSDAFRVALDVAFEGGRRDAKRVEAALRKETQDLLDAVARLRADFDEDAEWADQRTDARTAYVQWKKLNPRLRHHWASETHDELQDLHEDLRRLARIYEVDTPARR